VLGDIVLLAFEKILVLFSGHRKTAFYTTAQLSVYNCTNFFYNCTICAQLHAKNPCLVGSGAKPPRVLMFFVFSDELSYR